MQFVKTDIVHDWNEVFKLCLIEKLANRVVMNIVATLYIHFRNINRLYQNRMLSCFYE